MRIIQNLANGFHSILLQAHISGAQRDDDSRRNLMISSCLNNIIVNLIGGSYLAGFCLSMGGDANYINLVALLMASCNLLQLVSPLLWERVARRKPYLVALRGVSHCISLLVLPLLALLRPGSPILLPAAIALFATAQVITALINPGLQAWHIGVIPIEKRLGYYSFFHVLNIIVTFTTLYLAALLADLLGSTLGNGAALPLLRMVALALAAADLFCLSRITEHPSQGSGGALSLRTMFQSLRSCPEYLKIIGVASIWNFCIAMPSQYFNTYLLEGVGMSYTYINSVHLLNIVAVLLFTPLWKKFIQIYSLRGGLFVSILLFAPHTIGLFFTTPQGIAVYPIAMFYSYIFAVGHSICFSMVPYVNLPDQNRTIYLALYNTCCAAATIPGVYTGRLLFGWLQQQPLMLGGSTIAPARIIILLLGGLLALSAFVVRRLLKEPPAPVSTSAQGQNGHGDVV